MSNKIDTISKLVLAGVPVIYANTTDPFTTIRKLNSKLTNPNIEAPKATEGSENEISKYKTYIATPLMPLSEITQNKVGTLTANRVKMNKTNSGMAKMLVPKLNDQIAFFLSDHVYVKSILYLVLDSNTINSTPAVIEVLKHHYNGLTSAIEVRNSKHQHANNEDDDEISVLDDIDAYMEDETTLKQELYRVEDASRAKSKSSSNSAELLSKSIIILSSNPQVPSNLSNHLVNVGSLHYHLVASNTPKTLTTSLTATETVNMKFMYNNFTKKDATELKKAIFNSTTGLEELSTNVKLDDVGGYNNIKEFVKQRKKLVDDMLKLKDKGIKPKGLFFAGIPGSGKTLLATAIGNYWNLPAYKMRLETIYEGLVGSSEANLLRILESLEKLAPCYVLLDEADKKLAGVGDSEVAGSDVPKKIFGILLEFIAKDNNVIFAVTANRIKHIPEEFMRIGRFDKLYFMGKPKADSRLEIIRIHAKKHGLSIPDNPKLINKLIDNSEGQTGAEIEGAVKEAAIKAYVDNIELTPEMIIEELTKVRRIDDKKSGIIELTEWAKYYADDAE